MSSRRYIIVAPQDVSGGKALVRGDEARHLSRVLRAKAGEEFHLLDGRGTVYRARLTQAGRIEANMEVLETRTHPTPRPVDMAIAVFKPARMDIAVEKCTELNVRAIIPFTCERTLWKDDGESAGRKRDRLERKALAACKQCGRPWFTEIRSPVGFEELAGIAAGYDPVLLADREGGVIGEVAGTGSMLGICGPEGGLTVEESARLAAAGAVPVSLGGLRLRSETAAICLAFEMLKGLPASD